MTSGNYLYHEGQHVEVNKFGAKSDEREWYRGRIVRFDDGQLTHGRDHHHSIYAVQFPDLTSGVFYSWRIRAADDATIKVEEVS